MTADEIAKVVSFARGAASVAPKTLQNKGLLGTAIVVGGGRGLKSRFSYSDSKERIEAEYDIELPLLNEARSIISRNL